MITKCEILNKAVERITREEQSLQQEREAFKTFRDSVSRTQTSMSTSAAQTGSLLEVYKETVMSTPDFSIVYSEGISESLEAEFPPSIADALQENESVTQQFKRNLLVATTVAIESRTQFIETLEAENGSIRTVQKTVLDIDNTLQELPTCSLQYLKFERFVDIWETCEQAVKRCDQRSEQRQQHIAGRQTTDGCAKVGADALSVYLYQDLKTQYPALHALAETRRCIERCRGGTTGPTSHSPDGSPDGGPEASSS